MFEKLFRGKRIDNDEWVFGDLIQLHDGRKFIINNKHGACIDDKGKFINTEAPFVCQVFDDSVGQYTGYTDKNGTKIFEGDILHFKTYQGGGFACPIGTDVYYRVLFGQCNPDMNSLTEYVGFWALSKNYDDDDLYEYGNSINYLVGSHGACVIGNIHDNPELLKGGADNG